MTENGNNLFVVIRQAVIAKSSSGIPALETIQNTADELHGLLKNSDSYQVTDEEFKSIKKQLAASMVHTIGKSETLHGEDCVHKSGWYHLNENEKFFWARYKDYLLTQKNWAPNVVAALDDTTDKILDDLGDPMSSGRFQRRGLLLGDVQSGKTATYTSICNKAVDAGYRVVIVLAGMTENLRIQTQSRLDNEFVGLESVHRLNSVKGSGIKNKIVGVGLLNSSREHAVTQFTFASKDFDAHVLNSNGLDLHNLHGAALFVVKKNKSVLDNLHTWLTKDESVGELDLPLLLIDDEADNASINTNSAIKDPTAINAAINRLLRDFRQATYLGVTATPFANIFINSEEDENGNPVDLLFPSDFITLLSAPDNYIGADRIFTGNDDAEDTPEDAYITVIANDEMKDYYPPKHKIDLALGLNELPGSLKDAVCYFVLAGAVSDLRFDRRSHRSMMVNVSRFTGVQNRTAELIEDYVRSLRSAIVNFSAMPGEAERIDEIRHLKKIWSYYGFPEKSGVSWEEMLQEHLFEAVKRIVVRSVNQTSGPTSLDYYNYEGNGMRVIAVGGNSLSRGLTLEGLCVSYFYRNTMMYDTLLQMGRWFGYRDNYADLCRIWMGEDAVGWYRDINDAFSDLKEQLRTMARHKRAPKDFGLKIKQAPGSLMATARNKMRSATNVQVPITLSGHLIETPRLWNDPVILSENNSLCESFIRRLCTVEGTERAFEEETNAIIWRRVPGNAVAELVRRYRAHAWNLDFYSEGIADYIRENKSLEMWDVAVPNGTSKDNALYTLRLDNGEEIEFYPEKRKIYKDGSFEGMLRVNERHVRIASGNAARIGLSSEQRQAIQSSGGNKDRDFLIEGRRPLLLVHLMDNSRQEMMDPGVPEKIYGLSLGFPGGEEERTAQYVINTVQLKQLMDDTEYSYDDV